MKTLSGKLSFGVSAVQSGQKSSSTNAEPKLVINSTAGKFTITPPVTKMLGVAPNDYVQFCNNHAAIEAAIAVRNADLMEYCEANGLDVETVEGQDAILKEFGVWYIAKGIQLFDSKGNPRMVAERCSKDDKLKFIANNSEVLLEANRAALIERVGDPDASDETLIAAITVDDVESPKIPAFSGSKTATSSNMTGVGAQVSFTDSAIWNQMKADLGEAKTATNRIFNVLLDEPETIMFSNGHTEVEVRILPIEFDKDVVPTKRGKKVENEEVNAENEE